VVASTGVRYIQVVAKAGLTVFVCFIPRRKACHSLTVHRPLSRGPVLLLLSRWGRGWRRHRRDSGGGRCCRGGWGGGDEVEEEGDVNRQWSPLPRIQQPRGGWHLSRQNVRTTAADVV
jgi:hypothetical protein